MHFFYLDETGCTGANLDDAEQPIFLIGGISVKDQGWRQTTDQFGQVLANYFGGTLPAGFELHAADLVAAKGAFAGHARSDINKLCFDLLDLVAERKHAIHFVGIDKSKLKAALPGDGHEIFDCAVPYLLGFNYMVTYIERYTKQKLGRTVRSMIILDEKDSYHESIDRITRYRRFEIAKARRLKWLVEFSYPVDSVRHPMIQLSDLIIYVIRKFLEVENGYRENWQDDAKNFFASCYSRVTGRVQWTKLMDVVGKEESGAHALLAAAFCTHRAQWKRHYEIA